jgi:hypothetical protein
MIFNSLDLQFAENVVAFFVTSVANVFRHVFAYIIVNVRIGHGKVFEYLLVVEHMVEESDDTLDQTNAFLGGSLGTFVFIVECLCILFLFQKLIDGVIKGLNVLLLYFHGGICIIHCSNGFLQAALQDQEMMLLFGFRRLNDIEERDGAFEQFGIVLD